MKRITVLLFATALFAGAAQTAAAATAKATFAGGCFWCMEEAMDKVPGVISTTSGYIGGTIKNPSYEQVSSGSTGGTVRKFSPFGAVDIKLKTSSTGPTSPQYIPIGSTTITAPVSVTVRTRNDSTAIDGIPVTFAPAAKFSSTPVTTDGSGTAGSTWTLVAGANSGTATPAKTPLSFVPATINFSVTAVQLTTLSITTASLPDGQKTVAYGPATLTASGGAGPGTYSWALAPTSAALPAGLTLSAAGVLSGTPTVAGPFTFTVRVTSGGIFADATFSITIAQPPVTAIRLTFDPGPSKNKCYALGIAMTPGIRVLVTDQNGNPLTGVTVNMVAVTNNGSKVTVSPSSVVSAAGYASFGGPTINKTGGYALIASTTTPFVASVTSVKFNISPSC